MERTHTSEQLSASSPRSLFDLIVFDLDGTLIDSRKDISDAVNLLLANSGAAPLPEPAIAGMVGDGAATLVRRAFAAAACEAPPDAFERFMAIYGERLITHTRPYEGIPGALEALAARTPLAVLTNKPLAATREILAGLDLARHFSPERIVGGDGPLPRKPEPAGLLWLAADAGVPLDRTVLVGDSVIDWQTARNAGARACIVRYGYGFAKFPAGRLTADDLVVDGPAALRDL
jgi:phosphoglycolate phosphatase